MFSVAKIDAATGEIAGVFESVQPSDTDLGAKAPKDVKITGLWWVAWLRYRRGAAAVFGVAWLGPLLACGRAPGAACSQTAGRRSSAPHRTPVPAPPPTSPLLPTGTPSCCLRHGGLACSSCMLRSADGGARARARGALLGLARLARRRPRSTMFWLPGHVGRA